MNKMSGLVAVAVALVLAAACSSSGAGGREVRITQHDDGCDPTSISVTPGEKLKLVVTNNSSKDYEIEGIEGAKLEELLIPKGKTRSPGYTVPDGSGVHKLKCYVPGGPSTIIELTAGDGSAGQTTSGGGEVVRPGQPASSQKQPDTTVAVGLGDYTVTPDKTSVQAGAIRFIVTNISKKESHELAVLKVKDDGSFENKGEVEPIGPEQGGAVTLDLEPGAYKLACLVTKGEEGSTVDHYQQGMHTDFRVE